MKPITIFTILLILCSQSLAANKCAEVFEYQGIPGLGMRVQQTLMGLQGAKDALRQETTLARVNDGIYNMVVQSNRILDQAVEFVVEANFGKLPYDLKVQKSYLAAQMIEALQRTFEIGDNAMKATLTNRVDVEIKRQKELDEAADIRRAIGFGRDQSSKEFHAELAKEPSQTPGFMPQKSGPEAPVVKQPIGFIPPKTVKESIEAIVESMALPIAVKQAIEARKEIEAEIEIQANAGNPIGFVHPKPSSQKITEAGVMKTWLDVELGEFVFEKGQP